jgi:hypothetical protein
MTETREKSVDTNPSKRASRMRLLATALAVCAISLVVGAPGAGGVGKVPIFSFGSEGTQGGQLSGVFGAAINSTGNGAADPGGLYVSERANNRVSQFDEDGNFIRAWGKDVDSAGGSGNAEVCAVAASCQAGTAGSAEGEFSAPTGGVAVRQSTGDVYVLDNVNQRVQQLRQTEPSSAPGAGAWTTAPRNSRSAPRPARRASPAPAAVSSTSASVAVLAASPSTPPETST